MEVPEILPVTAFMLRASLRRLGFRAIKTQGPCSLIYGLGFRVQFLPGTLSKTVNRVS